eukprot:4512567-Alexandrium_andersonii.AAC.1
MALTPTRTIRTKDVMLPALRAVRRHERRLPRRRTAARTCRRRSSCQPSPKRRSTVPGSPTRARSWPR